MARPTREPIAYPARDPMEPVELFDPAETNTGGDELLAWGVALMAATLDVQGADIVTLAVAPGGYRGACPGDDPADPGGRGQCQRKGPVPGRRNPTWA